MARHKIPAGRRKKLGAATIPKRSAVPDRLDLRDRLYLPPVAVVPGVTFAPKTNIPVLDQGQTNACTGFALASVVYQLQHSAKRKQIDCCVAPFMLYSMARRYDEFPGDPDVDTGSSLRGAMKGWYKHGVCSDKLWTTEKMPTAQGKSQQTTGGLMPCSVHSGPITASTRVRSPICTWHSTRSAFSMPALSVTPAGMKDCRAQPRHDRRVLDNSVSEGSSQRRWPCLCDRRL